MGEYTGRRRGRAASEPSAHEPEYGYFAEDSSYPQQQPEGYGYEYGYEQPVAEYQGYEPQQQQYGYEYTPDPYEQYPSYEQYQGYEQQQGAYYDDYAQDYQQPYPQGEYQQEGYQEPYYEPQYEEPPVRSRRRSAPAEPYAESYVEPYADPYTDPYADSYAEPYSDPDGYADGYSDPYPDEYSDAPATAATYNHNPTPLPPLAHLPYSGAATAALAATAFVSAKAVAAVVLPLQLVVAWAVLDLAGYASRRTAVLAALPAMAGAAATFKFQPDDAAVPVAAGLGAGFVLVAADAVVRARRRGVEPDSVRALAAAVSALLFSGLTGMFLPAAVLHLTSVAAGAGVCAVLSVSAARNSELGARRAAVVAIPVTIAALASYAAAILVP